jgi:uncharacterized phage protein (TIGR01671 family)
MASIRSGVGENMEDRYLFKAKRLDNGEWVIGNLIQNPFFKGVRSWISSEQEDKTRLRSISRTQALWNSIEVDSSTICQCTGLKDKNGKLIWENDVVKINNSKVNTLITFRDFEIICTIPNEKYYKHRLEYDTEYEVIGNKFDNPELLESEE